MSATRWTSSEAMRVPSFLWIFPEIDYECIHVDILHGSIQHFVLHIVFFFTLFFSRPIVLVQAKLPKFAFNYFIGQSRYSEKVYVDLNMYMFYNLFRQLPIKEHLGGSNQKGSFWQQSHWNKSSSSFMETKCNMAGFPETVANELTSENTTSRILRKELVHCIKSKCYYLDYKPRRWKSPASV